MQTIKELAEKAGVTPQAVYKAKAKAESQYGEIKGVVDQKDNRIVRYSVDDCRKIMEFTKTKGVEGDLTTVDQPLSESRIQIVDCEVLSDEPTDLALPETFSVSAMIRVFDGVIGRSTDGQEAVNVVQAVISAGKKGLAQKRDQQLQTLQALEDQERQIDRMAADGIVDMKILASESRILADRQTQVSKRIQSKVDEITGLGKPQDQDGSSG